MVAVLFPFQEWEDHVLSVITALGLLLILCPVRGEHSLTSPN